MMGWERELMEVDNAGHSLDYYLHFLINFQIPCGESKRFGG